MIDAYARRILGRRCSTSMTTPLVLDAIEQAIWTRHRAGFQVHGVARRVDRMADLEPYGIRTLAMDVIDEESTTRGVQQIPAEAGRIDVLVNNAGYGSYGALEDVPLDEARRQFEVNVFGAARLTQLVLPGMRQRRSGTIINERSGPSGAESPPNTCERRQVAARTRSRRTRLRSRSILRSPPVSPRRPRPSQT